MIELTGTSWDIKRAVELRADALAWLVQVAREIRTTDGIKPHVQRAAYVMLDEAERVICTVAPARQWIAAGPWSSDPPGDVLGITTYSLLAGLPKQSFDEAIWNIVDENEHVIKSEVITNLNPTALTSYEATKICESLELSIEGVAYTLGVSQATVTRWKREGTPRGPASALMRLLASDM